MQIEQNLNHISSGPPDTKLKLTKRMPFGNLDLIGFSNLPYILMSWEEKKSSVFRIQPLQDDPRAIFFWGCSVLGN